MPNYLINDKESCGYATLLEWINYNLQSKPQPINAHYLRVSAIQYQMGTIKIFEEFTKHCEFFVDTASDYRSDFVVFPEMITLQLLSFLDHKQPSRELNNYTPQYESLFTYLTIKYNINIIAGSHFIIEDEKLYNVSYLFGRDSTFDKQ